MTKELIVVALGGNAIKQADEKGTTEEQLRNVDATAAELVKLIKMGYDLVVTHGNGPQVGDLLIQQEEAQEYVPPKTLYLCGAMTQGQIGWMVQNRLQHHLAREGIDKPVCTVVTQVVVDDADPDFQDPSKPVGPFYTKEEAMELVRDWGYIVKEVRPGKERGWRRVVPSPEPIDIVEKEAIARLVRQGVIVVASGGGGIPVKRNEDGSYSGVDAVIDKDLAGFKLAQVVEADRFVILTDVEKAYLNYGKPDQRPLDVLKADEAERYLDEGHFLMGSMGPKVKACVRFVRWSGKEAIISSLDRAIDALQGRTGTRIVP